MSDKNWLIRTNQNQIVGPISREKVLELLENGSIKSDDELCSGNGYWFLANESSHIEKYVKNNTTQPFNPVSEAMDVLTLGPGQSMKARDEKSKQKKSGGSHRVSSLIEKTDSTTVDISTLPPPKQADASKKEDGQKKEIDNLYMQDKMKGKRAAVFELEEMPIPRPNAKGGNNKYPDPKDLEFPSINGSVMGNVNVEGKSIEDISSPDITTFTKIELNDEDSDGKKNTPLDELNKSSVVPSPPEVAQDSSTFSIEDLEHLKKSKNDNQSNIQSENILGDRNNVSLPTTPEADQVYKDTKKYIRNDKNLGVILCILVILLLVVLIVKKTIVLSDLNIFRFNVIDTLMAQESNIVLSSKKKSFLGHPSKPKVDQFTPHQTFSD